MVCIIKTVIASTILMFAGVNLIGLITRGFKWSLPPIDAPTDQVREVLVGESQRMIRANMAMTLGGFLLTAAFLFGLFYFWNLWLAVAGSVVMLARIPYLLWELKSHREPLAKPSPQGTVYIVALILMWGTPLLVWYSLCRITH